MNSAPYKTVHSADTSDKAAKFATLWVPFWFFFISNAKGLTFWRMFLTGQDPTQINQITAIGEGSGLDSTVLSTLMFIAVFFMRKRQTAAKKYIKENYWLVLFIAFMGLSCIWSPFHLMCLRKWIKCIGGFTMVLLIATEEQPLEYGIRLLELLAASLILGSLIFVHFYPSLGRQMLDGEYMWTGLANHKNQLGQFAAVATVLFLGRLLFIPEARRRVYFFIMFVLSAYTLINTHSSSSKAVTYMGAIIVIICKLSEKWGLIGKTARTFFATSIVVVSALFLNGLLPEDVTGEMLASQGKDPTFSGRTELWQLCVEDIDIGRMLVGSGYQSFWLTERANQIRIECGWGMFSAHNGYIDLLLNLGIIGCVLFLMYLVNVLRSFSKLQTHDFGIYSLWMAFLVMVIVASFFESYLVVPGILYFLLLLSQSIKPKPEEENVPQS